MVFDPSKFTAPLAKPLPVLALLDTSSSMHGSKIDALNQAVAEMLASFSRQEKRETEILFSAITFGGDVELHTPWTTASRVNWQPLQVRGNTPMGTALEMAKALIEDKDTTPSRAYRPVVILISDGEPTGKWESALQAFTGGGRSAKCDRMAMAIGKNASREPLQRFIEGTPHTLFTAENASALSDFFRMVTMSVTLRLASVNPNIVPDPQDVALDGGSVQPSASAAADSQYW